MGRGTKSIVPPDGAARVPALGRNAMLFALAAISYFAAAQLGLALRHHPEGVAVFWPASGLAAGLLLLARPGGQVPIALGVLFATFTVSWTERDGPAPAGDQRRGFGYEVMVEMPEYRLDAVVNLFHPPDGTTWRLSAPLKKIVGDAGALAR